MKVSQSEKRRWSYLILGYIFNVENLAKIYVYVNTLLGSSQGLERRACKCGALKIKLYKLHDKSTSATNLLWVPIQETDWKYRFCP